VIYIRVSYLIVYNVLKYMREIESWITFVLCSLRKKYLQNQFTKKIWRRSIVGVQTNWYVGLSFIFFIAKYKRIKLLFMYHCKSLM